MLLAVLKVKEDLGVLWLSDVRQASNELPIVLIAHVSQEVLAFGDEHVGGYDRASVLRNELLLLVWLFVVGGAVVKRVIVIVCLVTLGWIRSI